MLERLRHYFENRLLEWVNAFAFSFLGCAVFIWPKTSTNPAFHLFMAFLPPPVAALIMLACGLFCIAALLTNGYSPVIGPRIRAWSAFLRAMLLLQFGVSTLEASYNQGFPFTVVPFWFLMAFAEIWVSYRAVLDVRTVR